jgi:zinc transporter, ZIP family
VARAFLVGGFAASSLLLGALIAFVRPIRERTLGLVMAFGAGVLVSAVAYDLVGSAFQAAGGVRIPSGLLAGALVFFVGDLLIDRAGGADRKSIRGPTQGQPMAIVLGAVLDGIPESLVLGLGLLNGEGVSVTLFVAVLLSNLPEAIAATTGLLARGNGRAQILRMWSLVVLVSAVSSMLGFVLLDAAPNSLIAFVQAFGGGAILTMLADTMMPEAFEHGGPVAGLATTLGFTLAFLLASLERSR